MSRRDASTAAAELDRDAQSELAGRIRRMDSGAVGLTDVRRALTHDTVLHGLSSELVAALLDAGLLQRRALTLLVPTSTFDRKMRAGQRFSREESDRIARLIRIQALAESVFEDAGYAAEWMQEPTPALGERTPAEMTQTDDGSVAAEALLHRIGYGDYA